MEDNQKLAISFLEWANKSAWTKFESRVDGIVETDRWYNTINFVSMDKPLTSDELFELYLSEQTVSEPIPDNFAIKENILLTISDLASNFLYYDRKEDEDLSVEQLNEAVSKGIITIDDMVAQFRTSLENTFNK